MRTASLTPAAAVVFLLGCARQAPPPPAPPPFVLSYNVITRGEKVTLTDHLAEGRTTVFDFASSGCGMCRTLAPRLAALDEQRDDLVVKVIDLNRPGTPDVDWESPVAKQYGFRSLPYFVIYGPDGKLLAKGEEAGRIVERWLHPERFEAGEGAAP